jgi:hypothetical protein
MRNIYEKECAPILLITFNRPDHTGQTLHALSLNDQAKDSILYCYIDGARNAEDLSKQKIISEVIQHYRGSFKRIEIVKRQINLGLAKNIIDAVTDVIMRHGKVIVLEDDIVTSKGFLKFMNDGLEFYKKEKRVWHIAAHTEFNLTDRKNEIFFWRGMNCWGWATWADRWIYFEKDSQKLINDFDEVMINNFDLDGCGEFWSQVLANASHKIDTWAIFWYATIFMQNGLCVNPYFSYAKNIGLDGSGVHCGENRERQLSQLLNTEGKFVGKTELVEDEFAVALLKKAYSPRRSFRYFLLRVLDFLRLKEVLKKLLREV